MKKLPMPMKTLEERIGRFLWKRDGMQGKMVEEYEDNFEYWEDEAKKILNICRRFADAEWKESMSRKDK